MISKEEFQRYEGVRQSGVTNMFAITTVMELADLSREQCLEIMKNYTTLKEQFEK